MIFLSTPKPVPDLLSSFLSIAGVEDSFFAGVSIEGDEGVIEIGKDAILGLFQLFEGKSGNIAGDA